LQSATGATAAADKANNIAPSSKKQRFGEFIGKY
jgi:hypothetical protein